MRGWQVVDCRECGLRYLSPRWPDAAYAGVYDATYYRSPDSLTKGYDDYAADRDAIARTFRRRFTRIGRFARGPLAGGRYLDVGCAYGFALDVAAEHGMDPHGVDISAHAVSEGRARGLKVEVGGVEAAERSFVSAGKMALVTSWDVIEHLPHPIEHLASIARMTQAGGLLSLITPDRGSAAARLLGRRWVEYQKPEEHIYFFNRDDVRALLRRAGFEPVDWSTAGKYVTVDFALKRLSAYSGLFRTVAQALGPLAGRMVYVDPLDKLHVIARRMG